MAITGKKPSQLDPVTIEAFKSVLGLPELTADQLAAIQNASAPSGVNPFVTSAEVSKYKFYKALMNQSGTDNPVMTVLENTLDWTPEFTRITNGQYIITNIPSMTSEESEKYQWVNPHIQSLFAYPYLYTLRMQKGYNGKAGAMYAGVHTNCYSLSSSATSGVDCMSSFAGYVGGLPIELRQYE